MKMVKESSKVAHNNRMKLKHGAIAPNLVRLHRRHRKYSTANWPTLETIFEEGHHNQNHSIKQNYGDEYFHCDQIISSSKKRSVLFLLPVFVSFISYVLVCRHVA
ncbi:hypothetical protein CsatB_001838 [Cannabis sativa]